MPHGAMFRHCYRAGRRARGQQRGHLGCGRRAVQVKALNLGAAQPPQLRQLFTVFHALGQRLQAQAPRQGKGRGDDDGVACRRWPRRG